MIEEFMDLLTNGGHWLFGMAETLVIDGIIIGLGYRIVWPRIRAHIHRDVTHAELHTDFQETDPDDDVH